MAEPELVAHWDLLIDGLQASPQEFYADVEARIAERGVPSIEISRVAHRESGPFSAFREYLRVSRFEHNFDVCGAPFGRGFFVSWWLTTQPGCLAQIPLIGSFLNPGTYYSIDSASMFRETIAKAVHEAIDALTAAKGVRGLTADERKPILKDFLRR